MNRHIIIYLTVDHSVERSMLWQIENLRHIYLMNEYIFAPSIKLITYFVNKDFREIKNFAMH